MASTSTPRLLIYLLRRDLRLSDNPVFHEISRVYNSNSASFTHLLPIYVFPAQQIEISGFIPEADHVPATPKSPYPQARSQVAGFWRCGPHRAKFLAESVWDLKTNLKQNGSDLIIRTGSLADVIKDAIDYFESGAESESGESTSLGQKADVVGVWMTSDEGWEERRDQTAIKDVVEERGKEFRLFQDEKYYIDDRDLPFTKIEELSDIFTTFRKTLEPLRDRPREPLPTPASLPPLPDKSLTPAQLLPFVIPDDYPDLLNALLKPLDLSQDLPEPPQWPESSSSDIPAVTSAHPFEGGESHGLKRIDHLCSSGAMSAYKDTRNGLLGPDFSTKLSAYLAIGCITSRQVHAEMVLFEDGDSKATESSISSSLSPEDIKGRMDRWRTADGFGKGENAGTAGVRFELLWRDYFRLVARKYGSKMFHLEGLRGSQDKSWKSLDSGKASENEAESAATILNRFRSGRTGIGLIDASQRELYLTGYSSNRTRQNVASFLSKHMNVDWRLGAEWYECMLVDYDSASNWGNWQYVAGVGNDPREGRLFNPVKQALDYDPKGEYIKAWVYELRDVDLSSGKEGVDPDQEKLMGLYQAWRLSDIEKKRLGLQGLDFVEHPLVRIQFSVGKKPKGGGPNRGRGRGGFRGRGPPRGPRGRGRWRTGDMDRANEAADQSR